jgi:hypothetical protein
LHELGIETVMLTGDNSTAAAIAQGGDRQGTGRPVARGQAQAIERYIRDGRSVGMVGDGINDAPALARADIGFAMGAAGSDTAIETADVALMDDDLNKIARFVQLSRKTRAVLVQNITWRLVSKPSSGADACRIWDDVDGRIRRHGSQPYRGCQWSKTGSSVVQKAATLLAWPPQPNGTALT